MRFSGVYCFIVLSFCLGTTAPVASQLIPNHKMLPAQIEGNDVVGTTAGFKVSFPQPPVVHEPDFAATAERAVYIVESYDLGQWVGVFFIQRYAADFAHVEARKRVLYPAVTRGLSRSGIHEFNHEWIVKLRAYAVHPETGQNHAMQTTLAPYRMLIQNVIYDANAINGIWTLGFFDALEVSSEAPLWVGPVQTSANGAYTVDLLGLEAMDQLAPGSSEAFVKGLSYDAEEGRADRFRGEYPHPPLNEIQATRLGAIYLVMSEFHEGTLRDFEHDLRLQPGSIDFRLASWEHLTESFHGLLPEIDGQSPVERLGLYHLISIASENPAEHREHFFDNIPLSPEKRDAMFAAYDERYAPSRPVSPRLKTPLDRAEPNP
ncbi:hypothetical protein [Algisphaera agarilytica]|uniref:Uncharacterized protein n=1 Tax=Algisphaera agarilytica TaxID=1385975 RepID=A0A7X0H7A1_9BACT|nr:hypothetical protein [Algisphaera agarilytica]MBB6430549.1 hypothetical protein [Algisphaera agarilytica]